MDTKQILPWHVMHQSKAFFAFDVMDKQKVTNNITCNEKRETIHR